jgi:uncharacterized protein (DUF983 family)
MEYYSKKWKQVFRRVIFHTFHHEIVWNFAPELGQMLKETKLYSIFFQKCPRCHKGELFEQRNPYKLKQLFDMPKRCSHCDQLYELEPSFFYGAMYVNYALTVAISVAVFVAMLVLGDEWEMHEYLIGITAGIFLFSPITFRLGRSIWINMFIKYDAEKAKDQHTKA